MHDRRDDGAQPNKGHQRHLSIIKDQKRDICDITGKRCVVDGVEFLLANVTVLTFSICIPEGLTLTKKPHKMCFFFKIILLHSIDI